jgi:hypothetical protein
VGSCRDGNVIPHSAGSVQRSGLLRRRTERPQLRLSRLSHRILARTVPAPSAGHHWQLDTHSLTGVDIAPIKIRAIFAHYFRLGYEVTSLENGTFRKVALDKYNLLLD